MIRIAVALLLAVIAVACTSSPAADDHTPAAVVETSGEAAYHEHCAGCHETGMLGAPVVGEQQDWQHRSDLWQAVVMTHAREGYFDMPARGGRPDLPDATIDAAVEYMLHVTYPELPTDQ